MLSPNFPPRLFASGLPHPVLGRVQDGELQGRRAGLPARRRHHRQHPGGGAQHLRPGPLQPLPPAQRQQGQGSPGGSPASLRHQRRSWRLPHPEEVLRGKPFSDWIEVSLTKIERVIKVWWNVL